MAALRRIGRLSSYKKGSVIYAQETAGLCAWLVLSGLVHVSNLSSGGKRVVLGFLWPGDVFGVPENGVYANTTSAVTDVQAASFDRDELRSTLLRAPQLQNDMLVKAVADLRTSQRHSLLIAQSSVTARVAHFLLDFASHPEYFNRAQSVLTLPVAGMDIADYLNISQETLSRTITGLCAKGIVQRLSPRKLKLSLPELERIR